MKIMVSQKERADRMHFWPGERLSSCILYTRESPSLAGFRAYPPRERLLTKIANTAFTLLQASLTILLAVSLCAAQQIDSLELQITSPPDGTVVNPGQTITVVVTPAPGETLTEVAIIGEDPIGFSPAITVPPFQFPITVPPGVTIRKYNLTAWGIDGRGQTVASVPITLSVESSINPVTIAAQLPQLYFEAQGQELPLAIAATFPDGSVTNVTESTKMTYTSSDASVVTVDSTGMVTAVGAGSTSVVARYGPPSENLQVTIPISVLPPVITPSPAGLTFGNQIVGTPSAPQSLRLTNTSNSSLSILSVTTVGDFTETDNCVSSSPIAAAGTCEVNVTFTPSAGGKRSGALSIANSARVAAISLNLTGTGVVTADTIPPTTTASASPSPNATRWNNTNVTINLSAADNSGGSGVKEISYSLSGAQTSGSTAAGNSAAVTISAEGTTTLTYFARDNAGNRETAKSINVQIDKTPPTVACSASPNTLWPPDHKTVSVTAPVAVNDPLSGPAGFTLTSATSNEADNGLGDGDLPNDIQQFDLGTPDTNGLLRAERSASGTGRVYTLSYQGMDKAGNSATCRVTVKVPHDQR